MYCITILLCNGCITSNISQNSLEPASIKLAHLQTKTLGLKVTKTIDNYAGHQYLLFIIPFGKVKIKDPVNDIFNITFRELALRGFQVAEANNQLEIEINDLSLSAYDLFLTRNLSSELSISCKLYRNGKLSKISLQKSTLSRFKSYGFEQQLKSLWQENTQNAIKACLAELLG